jgi:predicted DNA-binding transcriptional regulator YafY
MRRLRFTGASFVRRDAQDAGIGPLAWSPERHVTLRLRFQPKVLSRVYDEYDDERIVKEQDGICQITVTLSEDEWVYGHIMSYGCYVEVLDPEHVRNIIRERMKKALRFYT